MADQSLFSFFYTTCPDESTAQRISRTLLEEKLVACTNLFPVVHSQYWWQGKIESSKECVLILKTEAQKRALLQKRFIELHPYEVPCFLEIPIGSGNPAYLDWLSQSLK